MNHYYLANIYASMIFGPRKPRVLAHLHSSKEQCRTLVKIESFVGRDGLAQGKVDGMAFPGELVSCVSGRWWAGGKQPVACIVPGENRGLWCWDVDFAYDKCGKLTASPAMIIEEDGLTS